MKLQTRMVGRDSVEPWQTATPVAPRWGETPSRHGEVRRPRTSSPKARLHGLTLLELLTVIVILGLLASLLLPALVRGKDAARLARCVDNLRQLGLAAQLYWDDNEERTFPYLLGATNGGMRYWFGW